MAQGKGGAVTGVPAHPRVPSYTTFEAPVGYRIERTLGLCWGTTVRSRDVIGTTMAGLRTILGMRFDSTEIMQSTNEIIAYGTAVVVVPIEKQ